MNGNEYVVSTWDRFFPTVKEIQKQFNDTCSEEHPIWFRGQPQNEKPNEKKYRLIPSLFREIDGIDIEKEKELFRLFKQHSIQYLREEYAENNDWLILADMQHYGIPTRLLDWTDVLGMAVFFALTSDEKDKKNEIKNPTIFCLDPKKLNNEHENINNEILSIPKKRVGSYSQDYLETNNPLYSFPIAIETVFGNDRIKNQMGRFTIHMNTVSLTESNPDAVKKIVFEGEQIIDDAKDFLNYANINASTAFPDIYGLSKYLMSSIK